MVESSVGLIILLFVVFGIMEFWPVDHGSPAREQRGEVGREGRLGGSTASDLPRWHRFALARCGTVTTSYLTTWITKALAQAPVSNINPQIYGSNSDGSANTSVAWNSTQFGQVVLRQYPDHLHPPVLRQPDLR